MYLQIYQHYTKYWRRKHKDFSKFAQGHPAKYNFAIRFLFSRPLQLQIEDMPLCDENYIYILLYKQN